MVKVIIAGSRGFNQWYRLYIECDRLLKNITDEIEIVSGHAKGADLLGEKYAKAKGYGIKLFPADWNTYGLQAGGIRNLKMAEYADYLIAFWDGKSKGTANMIRHAKKVGIDCRIIKYEDEQKLGT